MGMGTCVVIERTDIELMYRFIGGCIVLYYKLGNVDPDAVDIRNGSISKISKMYLEHKHSSHHNDLFSTLLFFPLEKKGGRKNSTAYVGGRIE